jgi:hypothetical protein
MARVGVESLSKGANPDFCWHHLTIVGKGNDGWHSFAVSQLTTNRPLSGKLLKVGDDDTLPSMTLNSWLAWLL